MRTDRVLIVTGDDFGASSAVNSAVIRAHREGILTSASLMVNGEAFNEAVELAKAHPALGVGIHVALVRSKSALGREDLPGLADECGNFPNAPIAAGFKYFFNRKIKVRLERELEEQIRRFLATGLRPTHLDGHLHFHVHPAVLAILLPLARKYGIPALRLPREKLGINLLLNRTHLLTKSAHALIYHCLCAHAERKLRAAELAFPDAFFGLLASGHMNEAYLMGVIDRLKPGVTEIGMHPAVSRPHELETWTPDYEYEEELKALLSPGIRERIRERGIELASYGTWLAR
jgi:hopanoid biosynthesis associated protein HpnK